MSRMNTTKSLIAIAGLLGGLALAGVPASAQTAAPAAPGSGMMAMPNGQGGMMMNPEMMQKMSKMMDNCNHMMESMNKDRATPPTIAPNKG